MNSLFSNFDLSVEAKPKVSAAEQVATTNIAPAVTPTTPVRNFSGFSF